MEENPYKKRQKTPKRQTRIPDWTNVYEPTPNSTTNIDTGYDGWGDAPSQHTDTKFRIISGNINGLSLDNNGQVKTQEILTNLHTLETSAFLFQEINTDFKIQEV